MRLKLLALLLVCPGIASAMDANGRYLMHGAGASSCGTFVQAENRAGEDPVGTRGDMLEWAQGYLTLYNRYTDDVYDIYGNTDEKGIETFLYGYCRQNPLIPFEEALQALITRLYPRHTTSAPN